jgi:vitamin B12 transporter
MNPLRIALGASLALLTPALAAAQTPPPAQPDTFRLAPVVATATRLPVPLSQAPGSVTVLDGEELRERGIRSVADALRLVPGVAVVQSAGPGALTSVFIRGGESDYVQVLVDGVQVNEPGGAFDWAHLRADDVERIEIVRGPASVLYGSDAVAGVVHVITRAGGPPRVEAGATTGRGGKFDGDAAFATWAADASVAGSTPVASLSNGVLRYGANAARLGSNGLYVQNSGYSSTVVGGRLQLGARRGDLAFSVRGTDDEYRYPTSGSGAVVDENQVGTGRTYSLGAEAGFRVAAPLEFRLQATSFNADRRTDDPADHEEDGSFWSTTDLSRRKLDARMNWQIAAAPAATFVLTTGVEREWQAAQTALESISPWGVYEDETDESRRNTGVYAQLHGAPMTGVALTLGARIDDNQAFGTFTTGRAALSWSPRTGTRLHGAIGTAFKEPTFFENFATGFTRGNPDLQPEESRSWEVGAEYTTAAGALTVSGTWFDQQFRNLIQYTAAPPTPTASNYQNIGSATARGVEVGAQATTGPRIVASVHYTLTRTHVGDPGFGSDAAFQQNERLLRRPTHQATASLSVAATAALRALLDVRHVGDRDDLDFTDPAQWSGIRTVLPGYTAVDAGGQYRLMRDGASHATLGLRIRNVFDSEYQEIYNFPTPGRVVEIELRARAR